MTLNKQILLAMSMLVLLLLATAMLVNYKNTERFITDQLISNAENTASSLGVAIAHIKGDKAMSETFINAVFDSGYYELIAMSDMDGNIIYQSSSPVKVDGIPSWFIDHVRLEPSQAVVPLSSDWRMIGNLEVSGHRGHAYSQLWQAFSEMVMGFLVLGLIALAGIYLFLKMVLLPLKRVREQAEAVMERRFVLQDTLPRTKEMRDVVMAMNSLVVKVKKIYEKEAKAVADYNGLLYQDKETGYYNRDYFRIKLQGYLKSSDDFVDGYVLAFELHKYGELFDDMGANGTHDTVMKLRDIIDSYCCSLFVKAVRCRTRENDIMIILPASRASQVEEFAKAVCKDSIGLCPVDSTYASYQEGESFSEIMEKIDYGLMMAASKEGDFIRLYANERDDIPLLGHDEWLSYLHDAMENNDFLLMLQPVVNHKRETVQNELLLRLRYEDNILNAGVFMPIIAGVKMLSKVDRYVLERLGTLSRFEQIAVNISHEFISQSANLQTITSLTKGWKSQGRNIAFELSNTVIASDPEASKAFALHIQQEGWKLGIDHFTVGDYDLHLLQDLKPDYLKINAAYLLSLVGGDDKEASKFSLATLAELLEIDLIAMSVDSEEIAERLKENGITLIQGFWISDPKEER